MIANIFTVNTIEYLGYFDFVIALIYLILIFITTRFIVNANIKSNPAYKYYTGALFFRLIVSVIFCTLYLIVYSGGDSAGYFYNAIVLLRVLSEKGLGDFLKVWLGDFNQENYSVFTITTRWPLYWGKAETFFLPRFIAPIVLLSFHKYIVATIVLCAINFIGSWKLYLVLIDYYPKLTKELIIGVMYIPSVVFWSSGVSKDGIVLSAICWLIYGIHQTFIKKRLIILGLIYVLISSYIIISIRSFMFYALIPSVFIWVFHSWFSNFKNAFAKLIIIPLCVLGAIFISQKILSNMQSQLGHYATQSILQVASITQQDLTRESQYGKNYFNIEFNDPSFAGVIKKAPLAIVSGLFRPFIWEARSFLIFLSSIENLILLILTISLIFRYGLISFILKIFNHPMLLFSFSFSLIFALAVGLSIANFGALSRYKIDATLFWVIILFILYKESKNSPVQEDKLQ